MSSGESACSLHVTVSKGAFNNPPKKTGSLYVSEKKDGLIIQAQE